jgi:hypothetical protein
MVEPVSFWLNPYHGDIICYIADVCWALLILKIFFGEGAEVLKYWRQLGFSAGSKEYMDLPNFVDWVSVAYAFALMGMWLRILLNLKVLKGLLETADARLPGSWSDPTDREDFFELVHHMVNFQHHFRTILAVYPFVVVTRFFKAFNAQPRLSMVTRTLSTAAVDITHFAVVFFTVFFIFAVSGLLMFGQEINYFANFSRSFHTTFRVLIGDFDWTEMHQVGRPQAYIWFWTLTWGLNMVMLNMLLAIIMDTYSAVKTEILSQSNVETMWSQSYEIWNRKRGVVKGERMSLAHILKILDPTDLDEDDCGPEETLTVDMLMRKIPKIKEPQATELLVESCVMADFHADQEDCDMSKQVREIRDTVKLMFEHSRRKHEVEFTL